MHSDNRLVRKNSPKAVIIAGPNGAGKSTWAPELLQGALDVRPYVNADVIAQGLAGFAPETVDREAGELFLHRLDELASQAASFAFESTLAGRGHLMRLRHLLDVGYTVHLFYLWLDSPELAVGRVQHRVREGGHSVAPEVIRRRYERSVINFVRFYRQLATEWFVYDASLPMAPRLLASGAEGRTLEVMEDVRWRQTPFAAQVAG